MCMCVHYSHIELIFPPIYVADSHHQFPSSLKNCSLSTLLINTSSSTSVRTRPIGRFGLDSGVDLVSAGARGVLIRPGTQA